MSNSFLNQTTISILSFNTGVTLDWDVSYETRQIFELINGIYLSTITSVFGITGNLINILVFCKQGLLSSINVSFALLAFSDLCSLVTLLWYNLCGIASLAGSNSILYYPEVKHITAGYPHGCFYDITSWITVYIMAERCLCIAYPLTVKKLITPKRTAVAIAMIYVIMFSSSVPKYTSKYLDWKWFPHMNRSLIGLVISDADRTYEDLSSALFSSYMLSSFLAVPTLTCILLLLYNSRARWRSANTEGAKNKEIMNTRDRSIIKIVLAEGLIFTSIYSVSVVVLVVNIVVPEFNFIGKQSNLFSACFSFTFLLDAINSSLHFILYLQMSSNYRTTFLDMFWTCKSVKVRAWKSC